VYQLNLLKEYIELVARQTIADLRQWNLKNIATNIIQPFKSELIILLSVIVIFGIIITFERSKKFLV